MVTLFFDLLKTARPRQWVKNLTLYAGLFFTGHIFSAEMWVRDFWVVTGAIGAFTMVAVAIYFLNDVMDIKADQAHPFKKKRPIAAGKVSRKMAILVASVTAALGLGWANSLSPLFAIVLAGYLFLQVLYSLWLKNVEVVDIYIIAIGFFLRVLAGAIVINAHLSIWFLLCVVSTSLFLAIGKRRAELAILTEQAASVHRKVMGKYTTNILDAYLSMFATAAFLAWSLYTFNFYEEVSLAGPVSLGLISRTLTINKWLMLTIPVVIFGIMRYIRIIYDGSRAESPERVILSDPPLISSVIVWGMIVLAVLYLIPK